MIAYRIEKEDNILYGVPYLNLDTREVIKCNEKVEFANDVLENGMLYVPELDMIVDESGMFAIARQIDELTMVETETGYCSKDGIKPEDYVKVKELVNAYNNFYRKGIKFVPKGKEHEYLELLKKR